MSKLKFCTFKYKKQKIRLGYYEHDKLKWYASYIDGYIVIILNKNLNRKIKSNIFHRVIKFALIKKYIRKSVPVVNYLKKDLGAFWG